jgi:hypothetical protein
MKKYTDKELADLLLEMRQHNGRAPSWGYFKKHPARMVLFIGFIVVLIGLGVFAQSWGFCGFILGLVLGIFSRDRANNQQLRLVWPFYGKVIDWLKVERIANGEPSA